MRDLYEVSARQLAVDEKQKKEAENQFEDLLKRDEDQGTVELRELFERLLRKNGA